MEGIGSFWILKGENRFRGSRKVTGMQSDGGRFQIPRHRDGRNFVIGQPLKLTAVSQSSGIIDGLIWSQIQVSALHFGGKFQISRHGITNLALFCFHKTFFPLQNAITPNPFHRKSWFNYQNNPFLF
jgi:hypothetical protein